MTETAFPVTLLVYPFSMKKCATHVPFSKNTVELCLTTYGCCVILHSTMIFPFLLLFAGSLAQLISDAFVHFRVFCNDNENKCAAPTSEIFLRNKVRLNDLLQTKCVGYFFILLLMVSVLPKIQSSVPG